MLIDFCVSKKELSDDSQLLKDRISEVQKNILRCSELPTEWTVLQLCREYNPMKAFMLSKEILKAHDPLCFTLFCYPRSHLLKNEPISLIYHHHGNSIYYTSIINHTNLTLICMHRECVSHNS